MKTPLALAFLAILALSYLLWAQQQEIVLLAEEVGNLRVGLDKALKPKPRTRKPATPKES